MRKEFSKSGNPAKEDGGISLALEMQNRALEEEKVLYGIYIARWFSHTARPA